MPMGGIKPLSRTPGFDDLQWCFLLSASSKQIERLRDHKLLNANNKRESYPSLFLLQFMNWI